MCWLQGAHASCRNLAAVDVVVTVQCARSMCTLGVRVAVWHERPHEPDAAAAVPPRARIDSFIFSCKLALCTCTNGRTHSASRMPGRWWRSSSCCPIILCVSPTSTRQHRPPVFKRVCARAGAQIVCAKCECAVLWCSGSISASIVAAVFFVAHEWPNAHSHSVAYNIQRRYSRTHTHT